MSDTTIPNPTSSHILWGGAVEIHCFGRPQDWSLAGATPLAAEMRNPGIRYRMHQMIERFGITRIYAPNPSRFNAEIVRPEAFDLEWADERVMRGPYADGVLLTEPNTAFAVSSGDCPTVVLADEKSGLVTAAHAGFRSLLGEGEWRFLSRSMADAIEGVVGRERFELCHMRGFVACGIGHRAYRFNPGDPGFTEEHRRACETVKASWPDAILDFGSGWLVDLTTLFRIRSEAGAAARERVGFDGVCTYGDIDRAGAPLWHSNRRGDKTRNLVLVIRR